MTVCEVCGGLQFSEEDGHFYCVICQTQSQDVRVIEAEDEYNAWTARINVIRDKSQTEKAKKKCDDPGRPWSIYELYQIILLEQVEALIKLGADADLKDLVFKLWVNYLSKLGVAFSDGPLFPGLQKYGRQREVYPGTMGNARIKNVRSRKRIKKTIGLSSKATEAIMERNTLSEALENETFYEGDNPLSDNDDGDDSDDDDDYSTGEEEELELWRNKRKRISNEGVERMCMANTLCLCHLGLMYTNPATTLSDILRWVKDGSIPYTNVKHLIPSDFKFFIGDWQLLGKGFIPALELLQKRVGKMACFLQLSNFPAVPMSQLISKYILLLDLPAEMHGLAVNLLQMGNTITQYAPDETFKSVPFWDGMAMSYIIVVLRLVFALDDHTERLFSTYTRELMGLIDHSHQLFVWEDWVSHMKDHLYIAHLQDGPIRARRDDDLTKDLQTVQDSSTLYRRTKSKIMQSGTRDAIQQPFQELARRWDVRDASHTDDGHSTETATFDLTAATLDNEDPIGHLLGHYEDEYSNKATTSRENQQEKDSEKLRQTSTGENFRKSSLQHLIVPESYLDELDRHGLADYTILSSCGGSETDSYEDYDLGESPRKKRKHVSDSGDQCKTSLRRFLKTNVQPRPTVTKINNKSRYDFIVEQVRSLSCNFLISFDSTVLKGKLSYGWLLSICSCILDCDKDHLSDEVRKLEIKLFAEIYDFDHLRQRINVIKIKKSKNSRYAHRMKVF